MQHLPAQFTSVVPWLSGEQYNELAKKYRYRSDFLVLLRTAAAVASPSTRTAERCTGQQNAVGLRDVHLPVAA